MKSISGLVAVLAFAVAAQTQAQTAPVVVPPPAPPPPPSPWTSSVALGLTLTRGNSDTTTATGVIKADRKTKEDELLLELDGTYGENAGVRTAESAHAGAQYNLLTSGRFYYGAKVEALSDVIASIEYRLTFSPLVGYYLLKNDDNTLAVEAGPSAVIQKLGPSTRGFATLRLAERYEHHFTATTKLWESAEIQPQVNYWKNYFVNAEIGIESALTAKTSLRTYLQDTYYNVPATGRLKNDAKLVVAVAYKF